MHFAIMYFISGMAAVLVAQRIYQVYQSHKHEKWQRKMQEKALELQIQSTRQPPKVVTEGPCQVIPMEEILDGPQIRPTS